MDKEKVIKKIKQGAPATSAIVVAACIGVSLSGYQAPVYEAQAQTKETKTTDADEAKKTESKAKGSFDLADGINVRLPPESLIIWREMLSPIPLPLSLVVKKGMNICSAISGGIAGPLFFISISTSSASLQ